MTARSFLGAGDLYIARYNADTGSFDPEEGPFETSKFSLTPKVTTKQATSRGRASYGQVIETVNLPQPAEYAIDLTEVNTAGLVLALMGTLQTFTQGSGSLAAVAITAQLDKWVDTGKMNLGEAGLSVTNSAADTTYAEGTDYVVNRRLGTIKALSTGTITDAESLKVTATYAALSGSLIQGMTNSDIRARFRLDGINYVDKSPVIATVWEAVVSPDQAIDFLQDDFATISLTGQMKTPADKVDPYEVLFLDQII